MCGVFAIVLFFQFPVFFVGNIEVKVPKSVVAFIFLMIFILGVFAMEWWFPWLTGKDDHAHH